MSQPTRRLGSRRRGHPACPAWTTAPAPARALDHGIRRREVSHQRRRPLKGATMHNPPGDADYAATLDADYPATLDVDYPDRPLNRLTTFFRAFTIIPIAIVLGTVSGATEVYSTGNTGSDATRIVVGAGGVLVAGPLLMILFRQKYPRWWFDWNLELTRFENRVGAYLALLDDRYPATDEHQSVALDFPYPDARNELNRWLPLVKWFLAIPHYIALVFLWLGAIFAVVFAWFAILFTGR